MEQDSFIKIKDISNIIPDRVKDSHKGDYGKVALLGGAVEYSGAIRLAAYALSALKSGAGLSTLAIPKFLVPIVSQNVLEVMLYPIDSTDDEILFNKDNIDGLLNKVQVLTCGMGLGKSEEAYKIVYYIIENFSGRLVLDADALNILSKNVSILNKSKARIILTPHMMEFKRLYDGMLNIGAKNNFVGATHCEPTSVGSSTASPKTVGASYASPDFETFKKNSLTYAKEFVENYNITLLLKGPITYILSKDASIKISAVNRGTPGMSTAGSGDVLSGIIAGLLGYISDNHNAAVAAAYVNGLAGELAAKDIGEISMTASDTVKHIPDAIKQIKNQGL